MLENEDASSISLDEKVMIFVVMASEIFKKRSSSVFRQYGLTFSQYNVLKYLVACEKGRDTVGNVGKSMLVTGANITGLAKRMEKNGLIERKNDAKDERLTILQITPKGLTALDKIRDIQEQHVGRYLRMFSQDRKEEALAVLKHIVRRGRQL
jgi:MarR family transcriptional regulator, 2-MHQ and catechol-resistance regulon repressor